MLREGRGVKMSGENILTGCLVESDPATIARERQAKRRALAVAIILQGLLVGALVLTPLLGAVEKLPTTAVLRTPMPPYKGGPKGGDPRKPVQPPRERKPLVTENKPPIYQPRSIPTEVAEVKDPPEIIAVWQESNRKGESRGGREGIGIEGMDTNARRSVLPEPPAPKAAKPVRVSEPVQGARLVHRVEPKYPPLPRSAGIEGRVVLRAIIAKDGTIQSLEVVSGHPLFIDAAREAIAQWQYQATKLNGEAVEVETVITVVFTLKR